MYDYDVIIAGAGLGGLCAAAGLRRAGLRVLVIERDSHLASRPQGYRININLAGDAALRSCLPEPHFQLYRDTSHRQLDASVDIFDPALNPLLHRMADVPETGPAPAAVDRSTLRAILLNAAEEVRFACEVTDAHSLGDHVRAQLSNGSSVSANLLVAADGANSTLRRRLLPGHDPAPLDTIGIYGRSPLDTTLLTPHPLGDLDHRVLEQRFVGITDSAGTTLALGAWHPRQLPAEAAAAHVPGLILPATAPYIMWVLLCPSAVAPPAESSPETLQQFALSAISDWNPAATRFVRDAIVADTFRVTLRAMPSVPSWPSGRITFLGDAIHAMSPAGGEGANTAMADAASLVSHLSQSGLNGVAAYEDDLRQRAQLALLRSANYGRATAQEVPPHD